MMNKQVGINKDVLYPHTSKIRLNLIPNRTKPAKAQKIKIHTAPMEMIRVKANQKLQKANPTTLETTHGGKSREMIKTNPTQAAQTHGNHTATPLVQQPKTQTPATLGNPPLGKTKTMKDLAEKTLAEKTGQINQETLLLKQIHGLQAEKHKKKEIPIVQEIPLALPKQIRSLLAEKHK